MQSATKASFNLLHQPWIPCEVARGEVVEVGLIELFQRGDSLIDVAEASPLSRIALYRLLLAILYRTQKISSDEDKERLWEKGWDTRHLVDYLVKWEAHFDLYSPTTPFFQRTDIELGDKKTPLTKFSPEFAAGNNKQLFDHSSNETPPTFSPAKAARLLVACQCWSIGGGVSGGGRPNFTTAALPKGPCLVPLGNNLRETLLLNLVPFARMRSEPRRLHQDGKEDRPAWERAEEAQAAERTPDGPADYLTWQSRYLRLLPEEDGTVRFVHYVQGEKVISPGGDFVDPMHPFRQDDKRGNTVPLINPDRAVWRDSESLFAQDNSRGTSLALFYSAQFLQDMGHVDKIPVLVAGIAVPGGQPPPDLWTAQVFRIPPKLVLEDEAIAFLRQALETANKAAGLLRKAVYVYAVKYLETSNGGGDPKAIGNLTSALCRETDYWAALETPFHRLLPTLADPQPAIRVWEKAIRAAVMDAFDSSLASQDATGRHLRARNAALSIFRSLKNGIEQLIPKEGTPDGGNNATAA